MQELLDYKIFETIFDGNKYSIFRAEDNDKRIVILKVFNNDHPSQLELDQIENEYKILEKLKNIDGISHLFTKGRFQKKIAFVFKNTRGESLEGLLKKKIPLYTFFKIAKLLVMTIDKIHIQKIIHNDIKPSNILFDSESGSLEIINFGSSMEANIDYTIKDISQRLDRNLSYISPEQTGRVNHKIDFKSDYYSLGATLYHILTSRPPFLSKDSIDLIYSHIAKEPLSPSKIDSNIPEGLSKIILKLLSKNPEERYQSSYGLLYDLEFISSGQILSEEFQVGRKDLLSEFYISKKLYGRDSEIKILTDAFYSMYKNGKPELAVIQGNAGMGKSALGKGIFTSVSNTRCFFVSGKFDQYSQSHSFSGILNAMSKLIQVLLTETAEEIKNWKDRICFQLGSNISIVANLLPEIELIVGSDSIPKEQKNLVTLSRIPELLIKFIRIFGTLNHPLMLFLDDMQWADSASIHLIHKLMQEKEVGYIMIILGYRTSDTIFNNNFVDMLDNLKKEKIYPRTIRLKELNIKSITQYLSDSLFTTREEVIELAEIFLTKTGGNPFFINELLKDLAREKLITLDRINGKWVWDLDKIQKTRLSENIIELLINKIKRLPVNLQNILKTAACIGSSFDLWLITVTLNMEYNDVLSHLKKLSDQDFIYLPESSIQKLKQYTSSDLIAKYAKDIVYRFQHDRVYQAAYTLLQQEEKVRLQLIIGRILLQGNFSDDTIHDIVNHLNVGSEKIVDLIEIKQLIQLNLTASKKAKHVNSHESALGYLKQAQKLLFRFKDPWSEIYSITVEVYRDLSELYYLNIQFEEMEKTISIFLQHANNLSEITRGYRVLVGYYTTISQYDKAIHIGKEALDRLSFILPFEDYSEDKYLCIKKVQTFIKSNSPFTILNFPEITSDKSKLTLSMMSALLPATYLHDTNLWIYIVLKSITIILEEGICEEVYALSGIGIFLGIAYQDYKNGHEFAMVALQIAEKYKNKSEIVKSASIVANFTLPYQKHLREAKSINQVCMDAGKDSAEYQHLSYSLVFNILNLFYSSVTLQTILNDIIPGHMLLCKQSKSSLGKDSINAIRIGLLMMTTSLDDTMEQEVIRDYAARFLDEWKKNHNLVTVYIFKVLRAFYYYLHENYEEAYVQITRAKDFEKYAVGMFTISESNFIESLILCALATNANQLEKENFLDRVRANQVLLKNWSKQCPENFFHKYLIIEGEICRVKGYFWRASKFLDEAIEEAHKNEYLQLEALANEICARLYSKINKSRIMQSYLKEAYYLYDRWGAVSKVNQLEKKYPELFSKTNRYKQEVKERESVSSLDMDAVIKSSQALAEEIVLDRLLKKVMQILFENAGAEKGLFIRAQDDEFKILASGSSNTNEVEIFNTNSDDLQLSSDMAPKALIHYVARLKKYIVISDASKEELFINDPYLRKRNSKSILCYPVLRQDRLIGLIYLENNYTINAFTKERLEVLGILSSQLAISIENSELYSNLEAKVEERTANLNQALQEVKQLKEKQDTDFFLLRNEVPKFVLRNLD